MTIADIKSKALPILERYGATYVAVFGSVSRGDDRPDSDVDFLVRLPSSMDLFDRMDLLDELKAALMRDVDVVSDECVSPYFRPFIERDLHVIYEKR